METYPIKYEEQNNTTDENIGSFSASQGARPVDSMGLFGQATITQEGTTGFKESNVALALNGETQMGDQNPGTSSGNDTTSVAEYLARYRLVDTGHITNSAQSFYFKVADMLNQKQVRDKIYGSLGLSGVMKFKLTWNSDPTICGLYVMAYLPPYRGISSNITASISKHIQLFTFPHVVINIARDTSAELIVPYVGETSFIPLLGENNWISAHQVGRILIAPISQLSGVQSPLSVGFSLFFGIDDAVTLGNTGTTPVVQAGTLVASTLEAVKQSGVVSNGLGNLSNKINSSIDENSGWLKKTAGWLTGGAAKIAKLFGWSKPLSMDSLTPFASMPYADCTTSEGNYVGVSFANNMDSEIAPLDLDGSGKDPMIFTNLLKNQLVPITAKTGGIGAALAIRKDQAAGTLIGTVALAPAYWRVTQPESPFYSLGNRFYTLSHVFTGYRGGFKFNFHAVCTKFHSARLRVVYAPLQTITPDDVYDNMSYTYTWILDVSDPETWTMEVPYVSLTPFTIFPRSTGNLYIYIENELVAPESVASHVDLVVTVDAASDFEFVGPRAAQYPSTGRASTVLSVTAYTYENIDQYDPVNNNYNVPEDEEPTPEVQGEIRFLPNSGKSVDAHKTSFGDPVRSLATVIKRSWMAYLGDFAPNNPDYILRNCPLSQVGTLGQAQDPIAVIASLYTFYRGSMRFQAQNYLPARVFHGLIPFSTSIGANGVSVGNWDGRGQVASFGVTDTTKVQIPYYAETPAVNQWRIGANVPQNYAVLSYKMAGSPPNVCITRSCGDDFQLGFASGTPIFTNP